MRPLDPWPHSEAGRFHRVIALLLLGLAARWLGRDLRTHPANFPEPSASHRLRLEGIKRHS